MVLSGVAAKTGARACSFTGATVVLMADGTRTRIEDIEVGDEVIATDRETGEQAAKSTNGSQGLRVLPRRGVPGQPGVMSGAYLKYFGGPLHGTRVPLGMQ